MKIFWGTVIAIIIITLSAAWWIGPETEPAPTPEIEPQAETDETPETEPLPRQEVLLENLNIPWAIDWLPDNRMLFTERPGQILMYDPDTAEVTTLREEPVVERGEGGLLGLAVHPEFETTGWIYTYQTIEADGVYQNYVYRYQLNDQTLENPDQIIGDIPGAVIHNGGRIAFGPEGHLYITTGDADEVELSQDLNSLAGKILRVTEEGEVPPDNPFDSPIYSYGHRNPQGLAWDEAGRLWSPEHGPVGFDELNLITAGGNYGWPIRQGDVPSNLMPADGRELIDPIIHSGPAREDTWAPSGAAFRNGSVFFAGLRGQTLYQAVLANGEVEALHEHLTGQFGRLREVRVGPDGALYIATSNQDGRGQPADSDDRIIRLDPAQL